MNRNQNRPRYLRKAQTNWQELEKDAFRLLSNNKVRLALRDDGYRKNDFQRTKYPGVAEKLLLEANHTQKFISDDGEKSGMRAMTVIQEWMNILLKGRTIHTSYETEPLVIPSEIQTIRGLTIHGVLATSLESRVTQGPLGQGELPEKGEAFDDCLRLGPAHKVSDRLVNLSSGLSVLVSHEDPDIHKRIPPWNQIATEGEIELGYAWKKTSEENYNLRQGALFRVKKMREEAMDALSLLLIDKERSSLANARIMTIMSEVCTHAEIVENNKKPTFGRKQWGIGPEGPHGQSICFAEGNIEEQIQKSWDLIRTLVLDYPTDHPFPWERR